MLKNIFKLESSISQPLGCNLTLGNAEIFMDYKMIEKLYEQFGIFNFKINQYMRSIS